MIRDGRMTREEGAEQLAKENHGKPDFWDEFVEIIGINGNDYI